MCIRDSASGVRSKESGYGDVSLGVKWHVADEQGARPSIGVLAHVDLDSGSAPFRAQGKGTSLRLVAEWELANDFSLGMMPGIASQVNDDGDRYTGGILGIVVGKGWTDEFRSFVEYSSEQIAHVRDGGTSSSLNAGVAYLLTKTVQLDTALSRVVHHIGLQLILHRRAVGADGVDRPVEHLYRHVTDHAHQRDEGQRDHIR